MKLTLFCLLSVAFFIASCSEDPNEWSEERRKIVKDKCDSEIFNCDCFVEKTIEFFPQAQSYNKTLENESANQEKVDQYWNRIYDCMME